MTTDEVCKLKKRYTSKKRAKRAARILLNKGRRLMPYRCKNCNMYHLTKAKPMAYTIKARNNHP